MSVIMSMRVKGDPAKLEQYAADNPGSLPAVAAQATQHGAIAHRFYGSDDGQILVLDEWPDAASFQAFYDQAQSAIGPVMQAVGVTAEPEVTFWHKLETGDDLGWGA